MLELCWQRFFKRLEPTFLPRAPTEHLDFTFSLHFPREQRSYVCSCKEKMGVKSKIKGERGDLDLNNISQPRILWNACSSAQVLCLALCPKVNKRWRWTFKDTLLRFTHGKKTTFLIGCFIVRLGNHVVKRTKNRETNGYFFGIYMGKPRNPVGKSNTWCHSVWEASGSVGCDLRRVNFPLFLVCSGWFRYIL